MRRSTGSRATIAFAKLMIYGAWSALVAAVTPALLLATGLVLGLGTPDAEALGALPRLVALSLLGSWLAVPVAWAATLGRSVLAGVGVSATAPPR